MVLFWPFWLKAITLKYTETDDPYSIYNETVGLRLNVPALLKSSTPEDCAMGSEVCGPDDITYGASVNVSNFRHPSGVSSVSYVQLLASFTPGDKPTQFYVVSTSAVLNGGLLDGDNRNMQICADPSQEKSESNGPNIPPPTKQPTLSLSSTAVSKSEFRDGVSIFDDDENNPPPAPQPTTEADISQCCLGSPGAIYLVACIVKSYPTEKIYDKIHFDEDKKLNEYCVQVDGVCGSSCGFSTAEPKFCEYNETSGRGRYES